MNFFMAVPPCVFATRGRSIPGSLIPLGAAHLPAAALHVANGALRNHLKNQAGSTGFLSARKGALSRRRCRLWRLIFFSYKFT